MNDPEGNGNNETSTAETHYNEQNPEDRRDVLRSMAIGLGLGGIPTPLKKHLIKEAHRRYDLLDLRNAHPRPLKPSKTMWSVNQITRWLEEYPLRGNSCIAFIQATLQTTMPAGNGNNMNALPLDTLEEGGEETVGVEVDDVDPAPAAGREAATRIQDDQPQQPNDDTLPDPVANSTTATQPPQQATPAVKVGQLKSPPVTPDKDNVPIEKQDRRVLMTRVLGLPGCCLAKGILRHQELNGWIPTDEMLLDECRRRLGKRGIMLRKVLTKLLKDNPIQDDQECDRLLLWLLELEEEFQDTMLVQQDGQHTEHDDLNAPEEDVRNATKTAPTNDRAEKDYIAWSFNNLLFSSSEGHPHGDTNRNVHRGQEDDASTSRTVPATESETTSTKDSRPQTEALFGSESMSTTSSVESHRSPLEFTTKPIIDSEFVSCLSQVDFDGERGATNIVMMDGTKTAGAPGGSSLEESATTNQPPNDHGAVLGCVPITGVEDNQDEIMSEAARMPDGSSDSTVRSKTSQGKTTRKNGDLVKIFDIDPPGSYARVRRESIRWRTYRVL